MAKGTPHTFQFAIKKIRDISFYINEEKAVSNYPKGIKIEMNHKIGYNSELNLLSLILIISTHYEDQPVENVLSEIQVQNLFEINGISQYINEGELSLPFEILYPVFSMSISHSRALFYKNLSGTFLQEVILPVSDVIDVLQHFFPKTQFPQKIRAKRPKK